MTNQSFPYQLTDGTKAYAAKVMANFNKLLDLLNNPTIGGEVQQDIFTLLGQLITGLQGCVAAGITDNAKEIVFSDGVTLQAKLDSGTLNGRSGYVSTLAGMGYFHIDTNGNLILTTNSPEDAARYSINNAGQLTYTLDDTATPGAYSYNLGNVKGAKGDTGGITQAQMEAYVAEQLAAFTPFEENATVSILSAEWETDAVTGAVTNTVEVDNITATSKFDIGLRYTATEAQRKAFDDARLAIIGQGAGYFTLLRRSGGTTPTIDIPIAVRVYVAEQEDE